MLDKKICSNLQFSHRSYVKKPMEKLRSDKSIESLAAALFDVSDDGRAHLEYPFLFLAIAFGLFVKGIFYFRSNKND